MPDLYDLNDLAHVTGWEPFNLHHLGHVAWVESVLYRTYLRNMSYRQVRI